MRRVHSPAGIVALHVAVPFVLGAVSGLLAFAPSHPSHTAVYASFVGALSVFAVVLALDLRAIYWRNLSKNERGVALEFMILVAFMLYFPLVAIYVLGAIAPFVAQIGGLGLHDF